MYHQRKTRDRRDREKLSKRKAKTYQRRLIFFKEEPIRNKAIHVTHRRKVQVYKMCDIWYDEDERAYQSQFFDHDLCGDSDHKEEELSLMELEPDSGGIWPPLDY